MAYSTIDLGGNTGTSDSVTGGAVTYIDKNNPSNATGLCTTFVVTVATSCANCIVGTAYGSALSWTSRDSDVIGAIASGSQRTFTVLTINVSTNDLLVLYKESGTIKRNTTGGLGILYIMENSVDGTAHTYTEAASNIPPWYLTGVTVPDAPTSLLNVSETSTDVNMQWTAGVGETTGHKVYRNGSALSGTITHGTIVYQDTTGAAPTITAAGTAVASDGTYSTHIALSVSGYTVADGTTYTYTVYAYNVAGSSAASSGLSLGKKASGYSTYLWQMSAAASDASYSDVANFESGNLTTYIPPVITSGTPSASKGIRSEHVTLSLSGNSIADGPVRYFRRISTLAGSPATSIANSGYRSAASVTYQWKRSVSDLDSGSGVGVGLLNSNFETWTSSTACTDWSTPFGGTNHIDRSYDVVVGTYSCQVTNSGTGDTRGVRQSGLTVVQNQLYTVECWVKSVSGGTEFEAYLCDQKFSNSVTINTSTFTYCVLTITYTGANRSSAYLDLGQLIANAVYIIDNVSFVVGNYLDISGATTSSYNDTTLPTGVGRYYICVEDASGSAQVKTTATSGYKRGIVSVLM